ncbi:MAG: hypothetical protein J1F39_06515 [Clostridiales bacterium]|nr:hypothetical protein [Clostridiales bacterium]
MEEIKGMTVLRDAATFIKHLGIYIFGLGKKACYAIKSAICDNRSDEAGKPE